MKKNNFIFLCLIVFLAFFLRFYQLGTFPQVFNRDEAAIGYNAYTILTSGRDEFGIKLPLVFRSFGDYKMPLYIYLVVPCLKLFGVNEFSVRFPSALFGSLTVFIIYLLVKEITKRNLPALLASLFLAITPFHLHYSRLAFEANVALFLFFLGVYLFFIGLRKPVILIFSSIGFVLSLFCYFSPYFFVLPTAIFLIVFYLQELKKQVNKIYLTIFFIVILAGFLLALKTTILANSAKTNISIFKDRLIWEEMAKSRSEHQRNSLLVKLFDNQYVFYGKKLIGNYLASYSADFLFLKGGNHPWHAIPQNGNLYLVDAIFFLIGLYALFRGGNKKEFFFLFLLLLMPIPSAITTDAPHTTRLLGFLVVLVILTAYGVSFLLEKFPFKKITSMVVLVIYLYLFGFFLQAYLIHFPKNYAPLWFYGLKEAVDFIKQNQDRYDQIIIDNNDAYIYLLFYQKYPINHYLKSVKYQVDEHNLVTVLSFDKYRFGKPSEAIKEQKKNLFLNIVQSSQELGDQIIKEIKNPAGQTTFYFTEKTL